MKKLLSAFLIITTLMAARIWFDFSSPLTAYILEELGGGNGIGFSFGCECFKLPPFELSYFDVLGRKYISIKPIMLEGEVKRIGDFKVDLLFVTGIDGSFPEYALGVYLTTGVAGVYETSGKRGVFVKIAFEVGIRTSLLGNGFSPYYIKIVGPLVIRPALIVGGKF